jgi:hypothetical protein
VLRDKIHEAIQVELSAPVDMPIARLKRGSSWASRLSIAVALVVMSAPRRKRFDEAEIDSRSR